MAVFSVTQALVEWLASMGYDAAAAVPHDMPERLVTVERVGGSASNLVDVAQMAVQAWARTDAEAEALADEVRARALTRMPPAGVHSVRVDAGPYRFYDESTRRPRYQLVLRVPCQLETR